MGKQKAKTIWDTVMSNAESTSNEFTNQLRKRVTEYLSSEDWRVGGAKTVKGAQWLIEANDGKGRPIVVYQEVTPSKVTQRIVIATALTLGSEHEGKYAELSPEDKGDLIYDLRQHLLLMGVGYAGLADPLAKMLFEDVVYIDSLSKGEFLKSVRKVRNASLLVATVISRRFNEPPPPEPSRPPIGYKVPDR